VFIVNRKKHLWKEPKTKTPAAGLYPAAGVDLISFFEYYVIMSRSAARDA